MTNIRIFILTKIEDEEVAYLLDEDREWIYNGSFGLFTRKEEWYRNYKCQE